jgi:hypothetical protein
MGYETDHEWNRSAAISGPREATGSAFVPDWVAEEIKATWQAAREAGGETAAFHILERMVDRLGYGRMENNPSLVPTGRSHASDSESGASVGWRFRG